MNASSRLATVLARVASFIRLGRPIFLVGGFVLYALGAAVAAYRGYAIDWRRFGWGQIAVTATQLMTHYSNDYFDLEADRENRTPTRWSGGSRVLSNGELPRWVALAAALALALIPLLGAIVLLTSSPTGRTSGALLLAAVVLSWEYSAPPLRLHSRGVGELVAMVVVTLLVPLIGFTMQAGRLEPLAYVSAAPLCFLQFAMLMAVEFPDEAGDALVGKRTLVVRLGAPRAAMLYVAALALAYLLLPAWNLLGLPTSVALALALLLPLAVWLAWRVVVRNEHREPRYWNRLAFGSASLITIAALVELSVYVELAGSNRH